MTLRFVVVADSHIRFPDDDVATYPSNALMLDRNRRVVEICNQIAPEFIIHLGDIVHPLPVEDGHEPAVRLAASVYEDLSAPIHYVPGNHDVGDKPNALVAVPPVAEANYGVYERYWGEPFRSFDVAGCHFVIVDTPVLNTGMDREDRQRRWLENDIGAAARAGQRIFVFTHYPPFVRDPAEGEHYDNLGQPARSWFLGLLEQHEVEAVFSGHVHNFLYNHYRGTELYVLPSTGFVRPDYSELGAVPPEREGGRDDPPKLGFFVVDLSDHEHAVTPVRTNGATDLEEPLPERVEAVLSPGWRSPLGVTLNHAWMNIVEFPTSGLDEFRRKRVRNDATLPALWEARIGNVRVPIEDVAGDTGRERVAHLTGRGLRFTVRSAGVPDEATRQVIAAAAPWIERWEIVAWLDDLEAVAQAIGKPSISVAFASILPTGDPAAVHHFVTAGFDLEDAGALATVAATEAAVIDELVFRVRPDAAVRESVQRAVLMAGEANRGAIVDVPLPCAGENTAFVDDTAVGDRVAEATAAALENPAAAVFIDGFVDHDRSYYRHHGLIDRRHNPRPALYRLIAASRGKA